MWESRAGCDPNEEEVELAQEFGAASALLPLWQQGALVDVELEAADGAVLRAHRVVLAAASGFFRALLAGAGTGMREGLARSRLRISGVDGASLQALLHAIYSQRLPLGPHNVQALLAASGYLAVEAVQGACCAYLARHLCLSTAVDTLLLAFQHDCSELFGQTLRYLEAHFPELMQCEGEERGRLALLPQPLVARLLGSDSLNAGTELDVARAVAVWLAGDPACRAGGAWELLQAVRLPVDTLRQQMASDFIWGQLPPATATTTRTVFLDACDSLLARHSAVAEAVEGLPLRFAPRHTTPTQLLVAGGVDEGWRSLKTTELYDPTRDSWAPGPAMPSACSFPAGATLGDYAFVMEGAAHAGAMHALDRRKRAWAPRPRMGTPRANMAAAGLPGLLVVMGGRAGSAKDSHVLQNAECYSLADGCWAPLPAMAAPRTALGAAALRGAVYAVGGQSDRATHATAEWFEPGHGAWSLLGAPMKEPRKYLGAAALGGRLYAVGGMTHARRRLACVEALDPREGRWVTLAPMPVARSSAGVAVLQEQLFVVGGSVTAENQSHDGVECYDPRAARWRRCAPIGHGRSGLAVLPI